MSRMSKTVFLFTYRWHYWDHDGEPNVWAVYDSKDALLADLEESFLQGRYNEEEIQTVRESLRKDDCYDNPDDIKIWIEERGLYTLS